MVLFGLIAIVMVNFAANSVLTRAGVDLFGMDPVVFSGLRVLSGAGMLALIVTWRGGWPQLSVARIWSAGALLAYLVPFSLAYLTLPSGMGALLLFGVVQITMFAGAAVAGAVPRPRQWAGMGVAMAGLGWLLWPTEAAVVDPVGAMFMVVSGVGWGLFSLRGRGSSDPVGDMAWSFVLLAPVAVVMLMFGGGWSVAAVATACLCGAVTSGLGYGLWYHVLPRIAATTGAVAQLSVPVIAMVAGALMLGEAITAQLALAGGIVLAGIAVAVVRR